MPTAASWLNRSGDVAATRRPSSTRATSSRVTQRTDETELLADDREDEVGVRVRAGTPTAPCPCRARRRRCHRTRSDLGLEQLVAGTGGIRPGVEEAEQSLAPVGHRHRGNAGGDREEPDGARERSPGRARRRRDRECDRDEHHGCAHVGLGEDEERGRRPSTIASGRSTLPHSVSVRSFLAMTCAAYRHSANFASSEGWIRSHPSPSHLDAPNELDPTPGASTTTSSRDRHEDADTGESAHQVVAERSRRSRTTTMPTTIQRHSRSRIAQVDP